MPWPVYVAMALVAVALIFSIEKLVSDDSDARASREAQTALSTHLDKLKEVSSNAYNALEYARREIAELRSDNDRLREALLKAEGRLRRMIDSSAHPTVTLISYFQLQPLEERAHTNEIRLSEFDKMMRRIDREITNSPNHDELLTKECALIPLLEGHDTLKWLNNFLEKTLYPEEFSLEIGFAGKSNITDIDKRGVGFDTYASLMPDWSTRWSLFYNNLRKIFVLQMDHHLDSKEFYVANKGVKLQQLASSMMMIRNTSDTSALMRGLIEAIWFKTPTGEHYGLRVEALPEADSSWPQFTRFGPTPTLLENTSC